MNYKEAVNWLFDQVPNYQHQGGIAYKPGLERISQLMDCLGNPHHNLKTIHIAGTNGKGSVSHIIANAFYHHGYKTGLFTSPHIKDFRERIKINGELIDEKFVIDFVEKNKVHFERIQPSFFEITTAMALSVFANQDCDIAIIETGLGGRLDSTNIIIPELAIITNIGIDHTAFLGNTLPEIAREKAGIIKDGKPVVIGDLLPELHELFKNHASLCKAPIVFSQNEPAESYQSDLFGQYQQRNLHTAKTALNILKEDWKLKDEKINDSFLSVIRDMKLQGRLQKIGENPTILVDAAHNKEGILNLLDEVKNLDFKKLHIVYGAANDKTWQEILQVFPKDASLYLSSFDSKRAVTTEEFNKFTNELKIEAKIFDSPEKALTICKIDAKIDDLILICGSFYLIEKII